jgi:DNA-binding NtrC family response regulator
VNILVIDDDKDFLYVFAHTLRRQGHLVFTALNGIKALEMLTENPMDLIISDVIMSDTPILSLTCTLKSLYPTVPIVLMSGLPTGHLIGKSLTLGADEFLPKPINLSSLMETIGRYKA